MCERKAVARYAIVILGFAVVAMGLALMLRSQLGMGPWGAFEQVLSIRTGMSFGRSAQIVGLALIIVAWSLKERPTLATVLNMLLIGAFSDCCLEHIPPASVPAMKVLYFCGGLVVYSIGISLYVSLRMGAGPREAVMLGLSETLGLSIRFSRVTIDMFVLVASWMMKGPIGIGTVAFALGAGPLIQLFLKYCSTAAANLGLISSGPSQIS